MTEKFTSGKEFDEAQRKRALSIALALGGLSAFGGVGLGVLHALGRPKPQVFTIPDSTIMELAMPMTSTQRRQFDKKENTEHRTNDPMLLFKSSGDRATLKGPLDVPWLLPAAALAMAGGGISGYTLANVAEAKLRRRRVKADLADARREYEQALKEEFEEGRAKSSCDLAFEEWERNGKEASIGAIAGGTIATAMAGLAVASHIAELKKARKASTGKKKRDAIELQAQMRAADRPTTVRFKFDVPEGGLPEPEYEDNWMRILERRLDPISDRLDQTLGKSASSNAFMHAYSNSSPEERMRMTNSLVDRWNASRANAGNPGVGLGDRFKGWALRSRPEFFMSQDTINSAFGGSGSGNNMGTFMQALRGASPEERAKIMDTMHNKWQTGVNSNAINVGWMDKLKSLLLRYLPESWIPQGMYDSSFGIGNNPSATPTTTPAAPAAPPTPMPMPTPTPGPALTIPDLPEGWEPNFTLPPAPEFTSPAMSSPTPTPSPTSSATSTLTPPPMPNLTPPPMPDLTPPTLPAPAAR